jgi:hypothetical protein
MGRRCFPRRARPVGTETRGRTPHSGDWSRVVRGPSVDVTGLARATDSYV